MKLKSSNEIFGTPKLPGDKSISHRSLMFASLANGESNFKNMPQALDVISTEKLLLQLGVEIQRTETEVKVRSTGKFKKPLKALDCGNAGTLMRLIMGVLSAQEFESTLIGDDSLSQRPMKRVLEPLMQMGAKIQLRENQFAPVQISPSNLKGITYDLKIASAQLKSAVLLAGLLAEGETTLTGKIDSRDHTERLLKFFGAKLDVSSDRIKIQGKQTLHNNSYEIPNDISAGSFWIAAALLADNSSVELKYVGVNPTRMGFVDVLKKSGAKIEIEMISENPEPVANLKISNSKLKAFKISKDEISSLIDEVPLLVLIATQCEGESTIEGVEELRFKETDRIQSTVEAIEALGGKVTVSGNDLIISGSQKLKGGKVKSYHDHRIAMMAAVARYCVSSDIEIENFECAEISDPYFGEQISGARFSPKGMMNQVLDQMAEFL